MAVERPLPTRGVGPSRQFPEHPHAPYPWIAASAGTGINRPIPRMAGNRRGWIVQSRAGPLPGRSYVSISLDFSR